MSLDKVNKFFSILDDSKLNKYSPLIKLRLRASNKDITLFRATQKLDQFIGNVFSFLLMLSHILFCINKYMNEFEMKRIIIFGLFKNYEVNAIMMKKIKKLQKNYNEIDIHRIPDFNQEYDKEFNKKDEDSNRISSKENLVTEPDESSKSIHISSNRIPNEKFPKN